MAVIHGLQSGGVEGAVLERIRVEGGGREGGREGEEEGEKRVGKIKKGEA